MDMQTITIILNELPYKNDKAWNALRLAGSLLEQEVKVNIFLLEDGVDTGKENQTTQGKEYNLETLTKELLAKGVPFVAGSKVGDRRCGCIMRLNGAILPPPTQTTRQT